MGEILQFPGEGRRGFKRVRRPSRPVDPNQLDLFLSPVARLASTAAALSPFEQALLSDERGDTVAADLYAKAIENNDCVADAYCNLGIIESQRGNTAKAFNCFTTSLKHEPRHAEAHYNLGNLYFEVNDFRLAQVHYEMAREVEPAFPNVHFNLALVQSLNNEIAAAIATLERYQQLVTTEEAGQVDDLLRNLRQTLAAKSG
jgi:tetratricopeptide (TPR) repeat protein